ncbi:MAG: hypothetical protein FJW96_09090 [Actinobacteria bacterium]|nr:hypothetical protein [Actinomycetota bacterium]
MGHGEAEPHPLAGETEHPLDVGLGDTSVRETENCHEAIHSYGVRDEAETNCLALQLVGRAGRALGLSPAKADRLAARALAETRDTAPERYWNAARCRRGTGWDLGIPGARPPR